MDRTAAPTPRHQQTVRNARTAQAAQAITNDSASRSNPLIGQLVLPKIDFPTFKSANYHAWPHMARIFFVQHGLYSIVNGYETNPAGPNILPKVFDGVSFSISTRLLYKLPIGCHCRYC